MVVGVSVFELHLPASRSLKAKRRVVKGLIERIHRRFKISVVETDHHDLHQRSEISIALIARSSSEGHFILNSIRDVIDDAPEAMLTHWEPQLLEEMS